MFDYVVLKVNCYVFIYKFHNMNNNIKSSYYDKQIKVQRNGLNLYPSFIMTILKTLII